MQTLSNYQEAGMSRTDLWSLNNADGIRYFNDQTEGYFFPEENMLLFICEGRFMFEYGRTVVHGGKDQLIFLRKQMLVRFLAIDDGIPGTSAAFMLFALKGKLVHEFLRSVDLQLLNSGGRNMLLVHNPGTALLSFMASVEAYFLNGAGLTPQLVRIKILEMLYCLPGSVQDEPLLQQILDLRETYRGDITSVIEENIMNNVSLSQLARLCGRSLSSFRRDFLAIYNMPPSRWIRLRRLEKAQELLAGTQMTVTDICYTLGFGNIAHFSRMFKSRFGTPPSAFRSNTMVLPLSTV